MGRKAPGIMRKTIAVVVALSCVLLPGCRAFLSTHVFNGKGVQERTLRPRAQGAPEHIKRRTSLGNRRSDVCMTGADDLDMSAFFAEVESRQSPAQLGDPLTGGELKQIVMEKWKYPLETRINRRRDAFGKVTIWLEVSRIRRCCDMRPPLQQNLDATSSPY